MNMPDAPTVIGHQCMLRLEAPDGRGGTGPAMKRTKFMTNSFAMAEALGMKCDKRHAHVHLVDGKAKAARVHPEKLCKSLCEAVRQEKRRIGGHICAMYTGQGNTRYDVDDVQNKGLDPANVE